MIGPDSAFIEALGWIIVWAPMVISPRNLDSSQTMAPDTIFILKKSS